MVSLPLETCSRADLSRDDVGVFGLTCMEATHEGAAQDNRAPARAFRFEDTARKL